MSGDAVPRIYPLSRVSCSKHNPMHLHVGLDLKSLGLLTQNFAKLFLTMEVFTLGVEE